jgi:hypothetical protein
MPTVHVDLDRTPLDHAMLVRSPGLIRRGPVESGTSAAVLDTPGSALGTLEAVSLRLRHYFGFPARVWEAVARGG